jgi:hypothetical protein
MPSEDDCQGVGLLATECASATPPEPDWAFSGLDVDMYAMAEHPFLKAGDLWIRDRLTNGACVSKPAMIDNPQSRASRDHKPFASSAAHLDNRPESM